MSGIGGTEPRMLHSRHNNVNVLLKNPTNTPGCLLENNHGLKVSTRSHVCVCMCVCLCLYLYVYVCVCVGVLCSLWKDSSHTEFVSVVGCPSSQTSSSP